MKNKKGFVFVETIVTTVVLLSVLIYIYGTYSSMIREEKKRLYFDDITYVTRTQIIKEILEDNISSNFSAIVNENASSNYISVFNYGSNIFKNSDGANLLKTAREIYNFGQIFYIDKTNINSLKKCLRDKETDNKCQNTIKRIEGYGDTNFYSYLEKIDVSESSINNAKYNGEASASGILVVLFYKAKNGSNKVNYGTYNECVVESYNNSFGKNVTQFSAVGQYKGYFSMQCENAYYIAWSYFQKNVGENND